MVLLGFIFHFHHLRPQFGLQQKKKKDFQPGSATVFICIPSQYYHFLPRGCHLKTFLKSLQPLEGNSSQYFVFSRS